MSNFDTLYVHLIRKGVLITPTCLFVVTEVLFSSTSKFYVYTSKSKYYLSFHESNRKLAYFGPRAHITSTFHIALHNFSKQLSSTQIQIYKYMVSVDVVYITSTTLMCCVVATVRFNCLHDFLRSFHSFSTVLSQVVLGQPARRGS